MGSKFKQIVLSLALHKRKKLLRSRLSKELSKKFKLRTVTIRKGDKVKIVRGRFKGKSGTVSKTSIKKAVVFIEGVVGKKQNGTEFLFPIKASNLVVIELSGDRKWQSTEKKNI